jgi:PAS domain-containing protein
MAERGIHGSLLENMREGVISLDMTGLIITFDAAAEKSEGWIAKAL